MAKKALLILVGLFLGWKLLQWAAANPEEAATKTNEGADAVTDAGNGAVTFVSLLGGGTIVIILLVIAAIVIARRSR